MAITTTYEIHPAIGIARLGPSDEYFLAPEPDRDDLYDEQRAAVDPPGAKPLPDSFRDNQKNLKRQAVRFRIFECRRENGKVVYSREIYGNRADAITWTVHVANRKGFGPQFEGDDLRNAHITRATARKAKLIIDPGLRKLAGSNQSVTFDDGEFMGVKVPLGEAHTDADGRLLFIGARGKSGQISPDGNSAPLDTFADNDYWYDDSCDGVVKATIKLPGQAQTIDVVPAWVVAAPFDFAPGIKSFVTLYDVAYQAAIDRNWANRLPGIKKTDFKIHVLPILERTRGYRWVNSPTMRADVREKHAAWKPGLGADPLFTFLGDPTIAPVPNPTNSDDVLKNRAISLRTMFLKHLRDPDHKTHVREVKMPRLHDDENSDNGVLALTSVQYAHMANWAAGAFTNTDPPDMVANGGGEFIVETMDRLALEACSGGPFYPGMEVPCIVNDESIYADALRFDHTKLDPGEITIGLAVPWQADFFDCQMDGDNGWWPATRPDKVIVDKQVSPKIMADVMSEHMEEWDNNVADKDDMVEKWHQLGIVKRTPVLKAPRIADEFKGIDKPGILYVEDERILPRERSRSLKP